MTTLLGLPWWALLLLPALGSVSVVGRAEEPPLSLACPTGQVNWLRGTAAPTEALVVRFEGRVVGGGVADAGGRWAVPLAVHERPGRYPVQVERRDGGGLVAAFTCVVDLPLDATLTPTPGLRPSLTPQAAGLPTGAAPQLPSPIGEPGAQPPPTSTAGTATLPIYQPTGEALPPSSVPAPTATENRTPLPNTTPVVSSRLSLVGVQPHTPGDTELFEYVVLANPGPLPQDLAGWAIVDGTTGEAFSLPGFTLPAGAVLLVWSGAGVDAAAAGTLFWPAETGRWAAGDQVLLRDPRGQTASSLTVPQTVPAAVRDAPWADVAGRSLTTPI